MAAATLRVRHMSLLRGWLLAIAVAALCCTAGVWQVGRMHQKQRMLDAVAQVIAQRHARSLSIADDAARHNDYDWAAGPGHFTQTPAILLDNQQRDGRPGVRAYRLFSPERGEALLVELGWLPLPPDRQLPDVPMPAGVTRVEGLLMPPPSSGIGHGGTQREGDRLLVTQLHPQDIATDLALSVIAPRVLRLDPRLEWGYPRDLDVMPNTLTPQRHLGYAVQWFGLAIAVLVTALVMTMRKRRDG